MTRRNRRPLKIRLAIAAGTLVRWKVHKMLPGIAGAAAVSAALGELAGHVFGHGLAPWVGMLAAGGFALWFGREINAQPPPPPE